MIEFLRKLMMGLALAGFTACPGPGPTPPTPSPPTPTPPGPVATEMLLTTQDAKVFAAGSQVLPFMAIPCCMPSPAQVGNARWPLASEGWMDYTIPYGANMFHFRMGPFYADADHEVDWADIGGPYAGGPGSDWNPAFWAKVVELVNYAAQKKAWVEVNVIDTWYCKHAQWGDQQMPWPAADVEACGRSASPEQEKYIRKVVSELGRFGNVIWLIDNEGGEIGDTQRAWYEWVRDTIRSEDKVMTHLIGTNNTDFGNVADYVADHSRKAVSSIDGRWTINNERNPEFSPEQEAAFFQGARSQGLAWAFWRSGMSEEVMIETLNRFRDVINGGQVGCFPPPEDDPEWGVPVPASQRRCQRCSAVDQAKDKMGDPCGQDPPASLERFGSTLRSMGYCAGKSADSVFVLADDGLWEEHHVIAYTNGCYTMTQNGYKNAWPYANPNQPGGCPPPIPPGVSRWNLIKFNNLYDTTALYCDKAYCTSIGSDRACCPARLEGSPDMVACDMVGIGGYPQWSGDGTLTVTPNPWQARCPDCTWIQVCNVPGTVCQRLSIP